jgi:hypothetical protein
MLPFGIGLSTALGFALLASFVYGPQALVGDAWVLLTLFGLISASGLMSLSGLAQSRRLASSCSAPPSM